MTGKNLSPDTGREISGLKRRVSDLERMLDRVRRTTPPADPVSSTLSAASIRTSTDLFDLPAGTGWTPTWKCRWPVVEHNCIDLVVTVKVNDATVTGEFILWIAYPTFNGGFTYPNSGSVVLTNSAEQNIRWVWAHGVPLGAHPLDVWVVTRRLTGGPGGTDDIRVFAPTATQRSTADHNSKPVVTTAYL